MNVNVKLMCCCCCFLLALWGIDDHGEVLDTSGKSSGSSSLEYCLGKKPLLANNNTNSVAVRIQSDIQQVITAVNTSLQQFQLDRLSDREKNKRILYYFQKDLMAGLNEQLLDVQDRREHVIVKPTSIVMKWLCWGFLTIAGLSMLFYVFLFGLSRDGIHQRAWAQSFAIWLLMEIALVSSLLVIVNHVIIPIFTMKSVRLIKMKLVETIVKYNERMNDARCGNNDTTSHLLLEFNAAKYLFVSHRLATKFPALRASKIVTQYQTPWPRQSYLHVNDAVDANYNKKFSGITRSLAQIVTFFFTNFLLSTFFLFIHILSKTCSLSLIL